MIKKFIGDKSLYKRVFVLMLPIMVQNGITNFVNMLDNIMVGNVGQLQMTGVAVANQLIFVFNLCVFGAISGAGIFTAQYFGKRDLEGVKQTFCFKMIFCVLLALAGILLFRFGGESLMSLYLRDEFNADLAMQSLEFGKGYMQIMLIGLVPYTIAQCYGSTLRETNQAFIPMIAGVIAVIFNMSFNYILIFGKFGAPRLGVNGAAIATVISRFAELAFLIIYTLIKRAECSFILNGWKKPYVSFGLICEIFKKGMPLMINEALWAAGIAKVNQCYSLRGIDVVAANNISQTFFNVFSVAFMAVGVSIGIILGQDLGNGDNNGVKETASKLIVFSVFISVLAGIIYAVTAKYIPLIYNVSGSVRITATRLMQITALTLPFDAYANASYFTLRSGGKVLITLIFDSIFVWCVNVTSALILVKYTSLGILQIYFICQMLNFIKCVLGYVFVKRGSWIKNIISDV